MGLQLINQLSPCSPHLTIASIFKNCKFDISNQISFCLWNVNNREILFQSFKPFMGLLLQTAVCFSNL